MFVLMPRKPRPRRPAPPVPPAAADGGAPAAPAPFATPYHAPVMAREVVAGLVTRLNGVYVDATLGGGGHSAALLDTLGSGATVVGVDRDPAAIAEATRRLSGDARFRTVRGAFADMERLLGGIGVTRIDALLLDLGVSSRQIDESARGFAFGADGPLDMRMDTDRPGTAAELVNDLESNELADLLFSYGEEPRARGIARAIHAARPLSTTAELAAVVRAAVPLRDERKSVTRVFQALRIAVNAELQELEQALRAAARIIIPGGRIAVIAYHSLEDRRAKRFLRAGNFEGVVERDVYGRPRSPWRLITRHAVEASPAEVAANPRARSARLRIAERIEHQESPDPRDGGEREGAGPGR